MERVTGCNKRWRSRCLGLGGLLLSAAIGCPAIAQIPSVGDRAKPQPLPAQRPGPSRPSIRGLWQDALPASILDVLLDADLSTPSDRQALLVAIDHSLRYLRSERAPADYRAYPIPGIPRDRVRRSLERFRYLLLTTRSLPAFRAAIARDFVVYQSVGNDGQGTVAFTGYFEPVYPASRVPTALYRYPIFRLPPDLATWPKPHPTRLELEGADGLQFQRGRLKGLAIAWLRDRLDAFLIQVQGSARLQLTDGRLMTIGHAGTTDYPYTGIGRELVKAGKFTLEELTLPLLVQYFQANPADLDVYLPRNNRFVFFQETNGAPAMGSLGVPVTASRSIATDKSQFPPGALALLQTQLPQRDATGQWVQRPTLHVVLDQDTGGAIKGPGRVDLFTGTGLTAGDRAGLINAKGHLYYLLLK